MQGSVLGPLLFVIFINDLLDTFSEVTCTAFADDVKLYSEDPLKLQAALTQVEIWCQKWQLSLSVEKCSVLLLGTGAEVPLTLLGLPLPYSTTVKDLGVIIDKKLSFSQHCQKLVGRAKSSSHTLLKCFSSGRVSSLLRAYLTYIRPKLEPSTQVWNSITEKDSQLVERGQKYFTRMLFLKCGLKKKSYPERLQYLKIDTLSNRRFKLDLSLCHKIYHGKTHCPDLLVRKTATRTLQHNHRLEKDIKGGKHRLLQFSNRVVTAWNLLPDAVIEMSEDSFARAIGMRTKRASCPPRGCHDP